MKRTAWAEALWILIGMVPVLGLILMLIDAEHGLALTSLGSTAVLLFCFPEHEGLRPSVVLITHLAGALIGFGLLYSVGSHGWSMALGVALIAVLMKATDMMHPPAGANPLIVLNVKPGLGFLLDPLLLALGIVMLGVFLWSRLRPGSSWPSRWGL
ncbi:HPP family protein [Ferrovibrio sp. MS7]|uniref:HPP family protein n=1 Tax=Ferrovibrio plantarum TaxID=3119164 RepID=UPI00313544D1